MTEEDKKWYCEQIKKNDPNGDNVTIDIEKNLIVYSTRLKSDENNQKDINPEEIVHALILCLLTKKYKYNIESLYHEKYYRHGSAGSLSDEVDYLIYDDDKLPYALWEIKSATDYVSKENDTIKYQLFGTAPLVGAPKYLVYATIFPKGTTPVITLKCIDYLDNPSHESWLDVDRPAYNEFPIDYHDINYQPLKKGGENDLDTNCTQAIFRSVASTFHNEFFGEHADNVLFVNLVKCLLAKIYDERITKKGEAYQFQIFQKNGKQEKADELFNPSCQIIVKKKSIDI